MAEKFAGLPWPGLICGCWQVQMAEHRLQGELWPDVWCLCCEGHGRVISRLGLQGHWGWCMWLGQGSGRRPPPAFCPCWEALSSYSVSATLKAQHHAHCKVDMLAAHYCRVIQKGGVGAERQSIVNWHHDLCSFHYCIHTHLYYHSWAAVIRIVLTSFMFFLRRLPSGMDDWNVRVVPNLLYFVDYHPHHL